MDIVPNYNYRPIPDELELKHSEIDGYGIFTRKSFRKAEFNLDTRTTHIRSVFGLIRTPLGGFINHSEEPNCQIIPIMELGPYNKRYYLYALRDLESGEEITVDYREGIKILQIDGKGL